MTDWNPNIQRRLVKGSPAWVLSMHGFVGACLGLASTIGFGIGIAIRGAGYADSPALAALLILMILGGVYYIVSSVRFGRRLKAEARAGYTTCVGQAESLDEVDWKSARVIRLGTEPPMDRAELQKRTDAVRAAANPGVRPVP